MWPHSTFAHISSAKASHTDKPKSHGWENITTFNMKDVNLHDKGYGYREGKLIRP